MISIRKECVVYGVKLTEKEIEEFIINCIGKKKVDNLSEGPLCYKQKGVDEQMYPYTDCFGDIIKEKTGLNIIYYVLSPQDKTNEIESLYIGVEIAYLHSLEKLLLNDLIKAEKKLKKLFPNKEIKFYYNIAEEIDYEVVSFK